MVQVLGHSVRVVSRDGVGIQCADHARFELANGPLQGLDLDDANGSPEGWNRGIVELGTHPSGVAPPKCRASV